MCSTRYGFFHRRSCAAQVIGDVLRSNTIEPTGYGGNEQEGRQQIKQGGLLDE